MNYADEWQAIEAAPHNAESAQRCLAIIAAPVSEDDDDAIAIKEKAVSRVGDIYSSLKDAKALGELLVLIRPLFSLISKPRAAKMALRVLDKLAHIGTDYSQSLQQSACQDMLTWAKAEKLSHLHQRLQFRMAGILFQLKEIPKAISMINAVLREVRRADDLSMLVEVHLLESKIYHSIRNHSKARAALVAARTNAHAIYCPPLQQAEIDMQSGLLCAEEKDYKTGFSYLYEAFEGYHGLGDHSVDARLALRGALLMKIATDNADELKALLAAKSVQQYRGEDMDVLKDLAEAFKRRDVHQFNDSVAKHGQAGGLLADAFMSRHLEDMYEKLLESHLLRAVEPYRRVQIAFLAESVSLPPVQVEARLSQMILDKKLDAIVDQQHMCLVLHEEQHPTELYKESLTTLENLDKLVTALFDKVSGAFDHLAEAAKKSEAEKAKADKERKKGGPQGPSPPKKE